MIHNLSSALMLPVHPLHCYAICLSSNLLPTQPSKTLLLLDLSSIQLSHYAINTNSVIWAIRVCVCMCVCWEVEAITSTQYSFLVFFFFFPETAINQSAFKRRRPKASWEVESPWKPHRDPGSSGVNDNFHYSLWREGGKSGVGGVVGMNRERRKGFTFCKTTKLINVHTEGYNLLCTFCFFIFISLVNDLDLTEF